jgi:hypothetical protein
MFTLSSSGFGTSPTSSEVAYSVAIGGKADIPETGQNETIDPLQKSTRCQNLKNKHYDTIFASTRLGAGKSDHLGPLFGFSGDQFSEIGRRTRKHRAA